MDCGLLSLLRTILTELKWWEDPLIGLPFFKQAILNCVREEKSTQSCYSPGWPQISGSPLACFPSFKVICALTFKSGTPIYFSSISHVFGIISKKYWRNPRSWSYFLTHSSKCNALVLKFHSCIEKSRIKLLWHLDIWFPQDQGWLDCSFPREWSGILGILGDQLVLLRIHFVILSSTGIGLCLTAMHCLDMHSEATAWT